MGCATSPKESTFVASAQGHAAGRTVTDAACYRCVDMGRMATRNGVLPGRREGMDNRRWRARFRDVLLRLGCQLRLQRPDAVIRVLATVEHHGDDCHSQHKQDNQLCGL